MAPFVMLALRRVAVRALPLPSTPIAARLRPITTLTSSITRLSKQPQCFSPLQRRFASEEATQAQEHDENATSEEAAKAADQEGVSSIVDGIKSASSTAYNKASDAAESVSESVGGFAQSAESGRGSPPEAESNTVFVGNLFFHLPQEDLTKMFEKVGRIRTTRIITGPGGQSRGFGYVEYEDPASARKAVEAFHLQSLEGRQMNVQIQKPRFSSNPKYPLRQAEPTKTLFIGNMPFDMSDKDLNNLFAKIKNLVDVRVAIDRRTGQPRGFAHADFVDTKSAEQGMEMLKDLEVSGRRLRVDYSTGTDKGVRPAREASAS